MKIDDRVYVHGFVDEIRKDTVIIRNEGGYFGTVKSEIVEAHNTEDIVSVIRCKDCKYYQRAEGRNADEWLWCMMNHHYTNEEKYCAWAERKEE